jgi:dTDP-glucose pyrophosphorylase
MTIIYTMAGRGKRFLQGGFTEEKYKIFVKGKTLFEYALMSMTNLEIKEVIFVIRFDDKNEEFIHNLASLYFSNYQIYRLQEDSPGQAFTALQAIENLNLQGPILIFNIDTFIEPGSLSLEMFERVDGSIPCFSAEGEHWSFVKTNTSGFAVEIAEKKRISDNCSIGLYYFVTTEIFRVAYEETYNRTIRDTNEHYISTIYNYMVNNGNIVNVPIINQNKVHCLGTPKEVEEFLNIS